MRVDVGVEAIFLRPGEVPGGGGTFTSQFDTDDRLYPFETVLPGNGESNRRAVLRGQRFAIHADAEQRQRMHGFIEPQPFDIGIRQPAADKTILLARHLLRRIKRFKRDVACIAGGFDQRQQFM